MRGVGFFACVSVAADSMGRAGGEIPSVLFGQDYLWLWWIIAVIWVWQAIKFARGAA